jgi:hypothetical protein
VLNTPNSNIMKKTIIALTLLAGLFFTTGYTNTATAKENPVTVSDDWSKARNGAWAGDMNGKSYWYKLDRETMKLWWSTDKGKNWSHVESQMWADKEGKWMKIENKNVVWSNDMGKTWSTVPDWTWQGADGKWYKFDKDWTVWVK